MTELMKVQHVPNNLGVSGPNSWFPNGGADASGNPKEPVQFFPKFTRSVSIAPFPGAPAQTFSMPAGVAMPVENSPVLLGYDLHFALVSVWEQDGDQSAQIMRTLSDSMSVIGELVGSVAPPLGAFLVILGGILGLASLATAAGDDHVGDFVVPFGQAQLSIPGFREAGVRVSSGGNDWTVHLGFESKRLS